MFIHEPTGIKFENRKQAIVLMGRKRYKEALADSEFIFEDK